MSRKERTGWEKIPVPAVVARLEPDTRAYRKEIADGVLRVFVGTDPVLYEWHLSISHRVGNEPGRYPSWDEISEARYEFVPNNVTMAMLLPPREEFVNIHPTTFHLWQTDVLASKTPSNSEGES